MRPDFWYHVVRHVWWSLGGLVVEKVQMQKFLPFLDESARIVCRSILNGQMNAILPWCLDSGDEGAALFLQTLESSTEHAAYGKMLSSIWNTIKQRDVEEEKQDCWSALFKENEDQITHLITKIPPTVLRSSAGICSHLGGLTTEEHIDLLVGLKQCPSGASDSLLAKDAIRRLVGRIALGSNHRIASFTRSFLMTEATHQYISNIDVGNLLRKYGIGTHTVHDLYQEVCVGTLFASGKSADSSLFLTGGKNVAEKRQHAIGWNADDEEAYQLALAEGQQIIPHARFLLCGPGRSGKSSLERSMLDENFEKMSDSTIGTELHTAVCTIGQRDGMYVWRKEAREKMRQLIMTLRALSQFVQRKIIEDRVATARAVQALEDSNDTKTAISNSLHGDPKPCENATVDVTIASSASAEASLVVKPAGILCASPQDSEQATLPTLEEDESHTENVPISMSRPALDRDDSFKAAGCEQSPALSPSDACSSPTSPTSIFSGISTAELDQELQYAVRQVEQFIGDLKYTDPAKFNIDDLKKLVHLDIWDFAGQRLFAALQHMVLSAVRCAYAVVFDASKPLDKPAKLTICKDGEEFPLENSMDVTNFDIVESWLNTIHEVAGGDMAVPVYIVGTHIDKLPRKGRKEALEKIKKSIEKCAGDKAYANNIDDIVFVDNTRAGTSEPDDTILRLRHELIEKLRPQFEQPIPIRWIPFTIGTRSLAKEYKCPWLPKEQIRRLADAVCCGPNSDGAVDLEAMLKYHHNLGHILYYPHNNRLAGRIIIDVEWLLTIASLLFCPEPKIMQLKRLREQYSLLTECGILLESLAEHRWQQHSKQTAMYTQDEDQRDFIFELMEQSGLLYNTHSSMKIPDREVLTRKFYVPALVTRSADAESILLSDDSIPTIYLYSGRRRLLPQTLFWCIVVRCMERYRPHKDPHLFHSAARMLCYSAYWLVLEYFAHGIRIAVSVDKDAEAAYGSSKDGSTPADLAAMCSEALLFVEEQLEDLKQVSLRHVQVTRAVRCRCAAVNKRPCRHHSKKQCPRTSCHHFAELVEGEVPRCPLGNQPSVDVGPVRQYFKCLDFQSLQIARSVATNVTTEASASGFDGLQYEKTQACALAATPASTPVTSKCGILLSQVKNSGRLYKSLEKLLDSDNREELARSIVVAVEGTDRNFRSIIRDFMRKSDIPDTKHVEGILEYWRASCQDAAEKCTGLALYEMLKEIDQSVAEDSKSLLGIDQ